MSQCPLARETYELPTNRIDHQQASTKQKGFVLFAVFPVEGAVGELEGCQNTLRNAFETATLTRSIESISVSVPSSPSLRLECYSYNCHRHGVMSLS